MSGDDNTTLLDTESTRQDNSYHVVTLKGDIQNIVLDGFTISGGNANGPIDNNCASGGNQYYHTRGGAIYAHPSGIGSTVSGTIKNCIMENNTSSEIAVYYGYTACGITGTTFDFDFDHCIIRNNYSGTISAMLFPASGGYSMVSTGSVSNSLFHDNVSASGPGSVLYMVTSTVNGGTSSALTIDIVNNTFSNNTSTDGSVFYTLRANSSTFKNNIVWGNGNTTPFNGAPTPVISSSLIEGGIASSLDVDPLFTDAGNDDYTLTCSSPALDQGDDTGLTLPVTDLGGLPREFGDVDMGAYEYQAGFTASPSMDSICPDGSVTFTSSGATNVSWSDGITEGVAFFLSITDTVQVTGTDGNSCTSTLDVIVVVKDGPAIIITSTADTICDGTEITLSATGGLSLSWDKSVVDGVPFTPALTDTYTVSGNCCKWMCWF